MENKTRASFIAVCLMCISLWASYETSAQEKPQQPPPRLSAATNALPFPILPLIVEYDYAPLHFSQWELDDPHYSQIAATVTQGEPPVYMMILTERGSGRQVYYSNSEAKVASLTREGKDAHRTAIDYRVTRNVGQPSTYGFGFRDVHGRAILWRFIPATRPSERGAGLIPLSYAPGLRLEYNEIGTLAGAGTAVQIGDQVSEAKPWTEVSAPPYFVAFRGSHAEGRQIGALLLGSERWRVRTAPNVSGVNDLREGATWTLREEGGRERALRVTARRGDELTISETGEGGSGRARLELLTRATAQGFAVREVRLVNGERAMRILFTPELNMTSDTVSSGGAVSFEIDEGTHRRVAQGNVSVERQDGVLRLRWTPRSPEWTRSRSLVCTIRADASGYMIETEQSGGWVKPQP